MAEVEIATLETLADISIILQEDIALHDSRRECS